MGTNIKKKLFVLLGLSLFFSVTGMGQSTSPQDFRDMVVALYYKQDSQFQYHGSGFQINNYKDNDNLIATCKHLLKEGENIYINIPLTDTFTFLCNRIGLDSIQKLLQKQTKSDLHFEGWTLYQGIHLKKDETYFIDEKLDIAIIKWPLLKGKIIVGGDTIALNRKMLPCSDSSMLSSHVLSNGTSLCYIGFPYGLGAYSAMEYGENIMSIRTPDPPTLPGMLSWQPDPWYFYMSTNAHNGSSGSIILTAWDGTPDQRVIGIYMGHMSPVKDREDATRKVKRRNNDERGDDIGWVVCIDIQHIIYLREAIWH